MVLTNDGLNLLKRRLVSSADAVVSVGALGTSTNTPAVTDTGLNGNVNLGTTGTSNNLSITSAGNQILILDYNLSSASCNGSTFTEFGINNATYLFDRVTFSASTKSSSTEWQITKRYFFRNG